jgi:hypothetical protein
MLSCAPWWIVLLYRLRELLVGVLGLVRHSAPLELPKLQLEEVPFSPGDKAAFFTVRGAEEELRRDIAGQGSSAFPMVVFAAQVTPVLSTLVQSYGVGPLKANTVLLNWYSAEAERDPERLARMNRTLREAYRLGCNILISNLNEDIRTREEPAKRHRIDIWWQGDATGRMSLLLAYLMQRNEFWAEARLTVITAEERHRTEAGREELAREIKEARIEAERRAGKTAKKAEEAARQAERAREALAGLRASAHTADAAALAEAEKATGSAGQEAEKAARKAAKAQAKKELAAKEAGGLDPGLKPEEKPPGGGEGGRGA